MAKSWCYSFDNEQFRSGTFATRKAALQDAQKEGLAINKEKYNNKIEWIYISECKPAVNKDMYPDADIIIEHMECQAEDIGGEYTNEYPDVTTEQKDELTDQLHELLDRWSNKHNITPTFYTVFKSNKYDLKTLKSMS
ncbi:hypothetical protein C9J21_19915 [Photobacterium phosphoreum]|uniref:hypothetical protein n=1 Tax=Photobacterium phosphoreum TaxID=659 RepID=UPI000D165038|nr:hypothetical protein [Photobacterium phosphoreum]PSW29155.1 hypothetical protein C9J21_19915 [Photobacterium phosphoreum]